jgi:hypothetical protein
MSVLTRSRIRFGRFELAPRSGELFKLGYNLNLHRQPIGLLSILLERSGEVVTRKDLRHRLWPHIVDFEHSLNTAIKRLRQSLDDPDVPRYVETPPKKSSYRRLNPRGLASFPLDRCKFILTEEGEIRCNISSDAPGLPASSHQQSSQQAHLDKETVTTMERSRSR